MIWETAHNLKKVNPTFGYLKTAPGLLTGITTVLNLIAFICVVTSESANKSIHGGFLMAVTLIGELSSIAIILCHVISSLARKVPPYPFALVQVRFCFFKNPPDILLALK